MEKKNKGVIVYGGLGLIGKAIVNRLANDGWNVIVVGPRNGLDEVLPPDVFSGLRKKNERRAVVNSAYPGKDFHLDFFMKTTQHWASHFFYNGGGVVVNLASIYGIVGPDDSLYEGLSMEMPDWYAAAKGAIISHSRCLAVRYASRQVRINCVSPGGVEDKQPKVFVDRYCKKVPMGRMARPDDISGVVAFLLSDDAKYITGQNIIVDGGLTARV